jgi:thiamine kinase-like enzyme
MNGKVTSVIARIPGWAGAEDLTVEPLAGLTNTNYCVKIGSERFVLRVSGDNTALLGINREWEHQALLAAAQAGVGPEVVSFLLPEGHLVTRYIEGRHWPSAEYRTHENLQRIVATVKTLHALPAVQATFSPFRRVEAYARQARSFGVPFPQDFDTLLQKMETLEEIQRRDPDPWLRFCHNDLYWVNVLDDGCVRFVDWEFAGMGDLYFDLATLVYSHESDGPLSGDLEEYLLACYFGHVRPKHRTRLQGMKYMLHFFTAMWAMLQSGMQSAGMVPHVEGFDYFRYAEGTFAEMRRIL